MTSDGDDERTSEAGRLAFLAGGGEMGARTRAFDYSKTPLGPAAAWPHSLRTAVQIMLNSRYPMFLAWGRRLTFFYNDAYIPVLGQRHPAALGMSAAEVWSEIWSTLGPQAQAVLDGAGASWCEEQLLLMERNQFLEETYFTYSYSPIPDDGGGVGGVFCACTEDTHRVLSQRRLRTLRALAEQATQAKSVHAACEVAAATMGGDPHDLPFALLYLLDGEGKRATLAGCTGLNPDSPACPAAIGLDDPEAPWPFRRVAEGGKAAEVTGLHEKFGPLPGGAWPDSPKRAVVLPMTRPGHAQLAGFVVAAVSPRLVFNDEYKGFVDLIAGHVATAVANARAYEEEKKRAEALAELDRAKTAFFSNVSHEFRTPLTLLLGPVEEALADAGEPPTPRQQERLEIARRNALRLQKLVNTLLDFSRIEAGRAQACFEPVELAAFTCDLASNFRSACDKAGLKLTVDCPPLSEPAFVDRGMWEKVVLNLLSNAFKFTIEGEIAVSVRQPGRAAELQVRDTGTGIPAEEMPRLFERFHRVENAGGRTHEGSGIGLALVQELVRLHGGSIRAESEVGRGTTFVVAVPLGSDHLLADRIAASRGLPDSVTAATPYVEEALRWLPDEGGATDRGIAEPPPRARLPATPDRPSAPDGGDDRPRVLVADDNADMRQYVVRLLADLYGVEAVPDGEAALRAARERPPDLILADVMMPRLDGFGLLRELRADPRTSGVPVLLLSARAGEESRVEGLGAGADDYLVKPFGAREMLARVAAHLEVARVRRDAERRVTGILDSIADGFVALDRDWRYTYVNAAADAVHGVPGAELLGRRVWEAFPATVGTPFERMCRQAAETGAAVEFDTQYAAHDRWYAVRAFPAADGLSIYFRDVTDRRRADEALRRSEERFRRYFELGLIGMAITAPDKGIVEVNEEICRILGYPRDELLRKSWAELTHPDDAAADVARFDGVMAGEIDGYVLDKRWVRKDGRIVDATISVKCVRDAAGAVDYFVALLQDVTDRKRAEEGLRAADRRKDEFLAMLGHELRNPLAPLRGVTERLRRQELDGPDLERAYGMMDRQVGHLSRLVDDLLDVSRITRGLVELRKEPVNLTEVAEQATEMATPAIDGRGHELSLSLPRKPLRVEGDATRLTQIVFNLLNNAAKYTEPGGKIWLAVEREGDGAVVRVRDNGTGIRPELVPKVFDLFTQGERTLDRSQGGLGLGLTLVKRLAEMHGGTAEAKSDGPGKGSELTVRLPALPAEAETPRPARPVVPPPAAVQVGRALVVDDVPEIAESFTWMLEGLAREVKMAHSGAAAVEQARDFRPGLILCDLGMPGMDGYETCRRLRHLPGLDRALIAAVSGYAGEEFQRKSQEAGFDRHLVKPIGRAALEELVKSAAANE